MVVWIFRLAPNLLLRRYSWRRVARVRYYNVLSLRGEKNQYYTEIAARVLWTAVIVIHHTRFVWIPKRLTRRVLLCCNNSRDVCIRSVCSTRTRGIESYPAGDMCAAHNYNISLYARYVQVVWSPLKRSRAARDSCTSVWNSKNKSRSRLISESSLLRTRSTNCVWSFPCSSSLIIHTYRILARKPLRVFKYLSASLCVFVWVDTL